MSISGLSVYFLFSFLMWHERLNVPVCPSTSGDKSRWMAVAAPWRGVRMMGAKTVLVIGSNHILKYMISVATIPGSAQLTVIPLSFSFLANLRVNKVMASLELLYGKMRQKNPRHPVSKNDGKYILPHIYVSDDIETIRLPRSMSGTSRRVSK